ncbi:MAG: hypothetical protein DRP55_06935 [Spirochaetes bacterium]|nr:hypothetical protein [Deltaproteobacteria bacterium]RKX99669.1 MAG: hypothetical protein DRP55_06935 [Spirochaetota bacterium]
MYFLYIITGLALIASFIADKKKTFKAIKMGYKKFVNILPPFLIMLILVSVILFLVPDRVISNYLGVSHKFYGFLFAIFFGSITLMPGFIAYPLCGILLQKGVPYMTLSAFSTTLMMVGILTFPIEKEYFGTKVTIIRNLISLGIAIAVALVTGIFFNELF